MWSPDLESPEPSIMIFFGISFFYVAHTSHSHATALCLCPRSPPPRTFSPVYTCGPPRSESPRLILVSISLHGALCCVLVSPRYHGVALAPLAAVTAHWAWCRWA